MFKALPLLGCANLILQYLPQTLSWISQHGCIFSCFHWTDTLDHNFVALRSGKVERVLMPKQDGSLPWTCDQSTMSPSPCQPFAKVLSAKGCLSSWMTWFLVVNGRWRNLKHFGCGHMLQVGKKRFQCWKLSWPALTIQTDKALWLSAL